MQNLYQHFLILQLIVIEELMQLQQSQGLPGLLAVYLIPGTTEHI